MHFYLVGAVELVDAVRVLMSGAVEDANNYYDFATVLLRSYHAGSVLWVNNAVASEFVNTAEDNMIDVFAAAIYRIVASVKWVNHVGAPDSVNFVDASTQVIGVCAVAIFSHVDDVTKVSLVTVIVDTKRVEHA